MKSSVIVLKSMTEAAKACHHLKKFKVETVLEKVTVNNDGCGYGIRIKGDPENVCRLLGLVDIECIEIR